MYTLPIVGGVHVVGVHDEKYGEELLACVKLREFAVRGLHLEKAAAVETA